MTPKREAEIEALEKEHRYRSDEAGHLSAAIRELLTENERLEEDAEFQRGIAEQCRKDAAAAEAKLAKAKAALHLLAAATILANGRVIGIEQHHVEAARTTLSEIEDR